MASAAEVANDMAAHAAYWDKRDKNIARACRDAAHQIRGMLSGEHPDGRTYSGLFGRLLRLENPRSHYQVYPNFTRARLVLHELKIAREK
ncbi:MAG: hypothetical protein CSA85_00155 [Alphaproteobacteria bacterium]|nr:MAG: hypothetical protein CSA85_00155 [Alphaproteobacteria bacterium]